MTKELVDDYVVKLKPKTKSRYKVLILTGLLIFALIAIAISIAPMNINWWSDLWINISAGSISSLLTIFFIDYLINKHRTSKLIAVNKLNHHGLLSALRIQMINIMVFFGYLTKKERGNYMENSEEKFKAFLVDSSLINKLDGLEKLNKSNITFIKKLNRILKGDWEYLGKNIKNFKPYPDPNLVHKIEVEMTFNSGAVSVGEELFSFYFNELPKKVGNNEVEKMFPGMSVLWKLVSEGIKNPERGYRNYYMNSFNLLVELSERCKKEDVFFDI